MSVEITLTDKTEVTKLACPACKERVKQIGLQKDSIIKGLSFKCKKCGLFWVVESKKDN